MAFTIKELESLSGIKAHTIRIWEQRYSFLKPGRTTTNIRSYDNEELKTLLTVALLNRYGYKISRIDDMAPEQRTKALLDMESAEARNEYVINQLVGYMIDLKTVEFELLLNGQAENHGLQQTIDKIVFPFLERIGILWQTNRINPAHEHLVTNIIRQKVISAIDKLPLVTYSSPLFLLFLPEDEHHELGLLFVHYLLKKKGKAVLYLGASMPARDVCYVVSLKKPSVLYLHLTAITRKVQLEKYLNQLAVNCSSAKILISGSALTSFPKKMPENFTLLKSLSEVYSYIAAM